MKPRRNSPLLVKPPRHFHRIQFESRVRDHLEDPAYGVHTAIDADIAAFYAWSAWTKWYEGDVFDEDEDTSALGQRVLAGPHGYPVVVQLDVSGLVPVPDVDAILWWKQGGDYQIKEAFERYQEEGDADVGDWMNEGVETSPERTVSAELAGRVERVDWDALGPLLIDGTARRALRKDKQAIIDILVAIFPQRRYMKDFGLDRLVEVSLVMPWYDQALPLDMEEDIEPLGEDFAEAETIGLEVVGESDLDRWSPTLRSLWMPLSRKPARAVPGGVADEYHGMTSWGLLEAFPELEGKVPPADATPWRRR